jgi:hypothetical protein
MHVCEQQECLSARIYVEDIMPVLNPPILEQLEDRCSILITEIGGGFPLIIGPGR